MLGRTEQQWALLSFMTQMRFYLKFGLLLLLRLEATALLLGIHSRILYNSVRPNWDVGRRRGYSCLSCSSKRLYAKGKGYEGTRNRIFQDQFKKLKDPKIEKLYKDIDLEEDVLKNQDPDTKIITGDDLRSRRERDQFQVKKHAKIITTNVSLQKCFL